MYQNNTRMLLSQLENLISRQILTPTKQVNDDTFLCLTENTPMGLVYHQYAFDALPMTHRQLFLGRLKGETVATFKIVAVFDIWEPEIEPAMPVQRAS